MQAGALIVPPRRRVESSYPAQPDGLMLISPDGGAGPTSTGDSGPVPHCQPAYWVVLYGP
jgi:hypothetical protein